MSQARFFRLPTSKTARSIFAVTVVVSVSVVVLSFYRKPRIWPVAEVPIAFWSWHTQSPAEDDVNAAIGKAQARTLFLRAGQIDYKDGNLRRIRPLTGPLPKRIDLHLVYNATPSLLAQLETVNEKALATEIVRAYREDSDRALRDGVHVSGLQVDIDVPTRLLPRYVKTLQALRDGLLPGNQLSITGLPTWMDSAALVNVLAEVDFWVPQFYGTEIPKRSDQLIPISSAGNIAHFVKKAQSLDRPFYAGLPAYSCALLYSASGSLISLRGDMNPAAIAADPNLELVDQRSFDGPALEISAPAKTEWRYAFRARADGVTDDLAMRAGDVLVVHVPSGASLRNAAHLVRKLAGPRLLGICIFRLPERGDPATLTIEQIASAVNDQNLTTLIDVQIRREPASSTAVSPKPGKWIVDLHNAGTTSPLMGSLQIDIGVPPGSFEAMTSETPASVEPMCRPPEATLSALQPQPCSRLRANVVRLRAPMLPPGQSLRAVLSLNHEPAASIPVSTAMETDAGQPYSIQRSILVKTGANQWAYRY